MIIIFKVRYVYQALMDKLYCVLITTKTSNILEDLETLRLFVRVINEYTTTNKSHSDEQAILDNAFTLIFAFDEIVALGYRENVNMTQVRTFIEMDSNEERVFEAVRKTQEREAKQKMREKAKELSKLQRTQQNERKMMSGIGGGTSNISSNTGISSLSTFENSYEKNKTVTTSSMQKPKVFLWKISEFFFTKFIFLGPIKSAKIGQQKSEYFWSTAGRTIID